MPRRIPDYPSGMNYWNNIMTLGSFLTALSLVVWFIGLSKSVNSKGSIVKFI